ncbi:hypothetical protein L6164_010684 [Bauhinia variegata]|uniref:Uncharacterized protein n=1 Tax=Bauhinia variegata TaxID=167791 RepID=A0ACB9PNQ4_BAUVA|nr:hypothetical protein L6164_010684 [Bauhinia variegata]
MASSNFWIFAHFAVLTVSLVLLHSATATAASSTIYDHLRLQGLPVGLLPKGITHFSINTTSGEFQVSLDMPCNAKFENEVHYDFNISGTLTYGQIGELSGVSAQELFLWFPVKGIRIDVPSSGLIHFDVGVVDKQFSLSLFESPPDCTVAAPIHSDLRATLSSHHADSSRSPFQVDSDKLERETGDSDELKAAS